MNKGLIISFFISVMIHLVIILFTSVLSFFLSFEALQIVNEEMDLTNNLEEETSTEKKEQLEPDLTNINVDVVPKDKIINSFEASLRRRLEEKELEIRMELEEKYKEEMKALKKQYEDEIAQLKETQKEIKNEYEKKLESQVGEKEKLNKKNLELTNRLNSLEKTKSNIDKQLEKTEKEKEKLEEAKKQAEKEKEKLEEAKKQAEKEKQKTEKEAEKLKAEKEKMEEEIELIIEKEKEKTEVKKEVKKESNYLNIYPIVKHGGVLVDTLDFTKQFEMEITLDVKSNGDFENVKFSKKTDNKPADDTFKKIVVDMGKAKNPFIGQNFKQLTLNIKSSGSKMDIMIIGKTSNMLSNIVTTGAVTAAVELAKELNKDVPIIMTFLEHTSIANKGGVVISITDLDPEFVKKTLRAFQ